jgi:uncharacterized protein (DUF1330 family)
MHFEPTQKQGAAYFGHAPAGPVVMLNLLRFRDIADYSGSPELAPAEPISGAEAYRRYASHTAPFLTEAGGEVLFQGKGGPYLIGPEEGRWDLVLLVRHASAQAFLAFASNQEYLAGLGHRTAALEDSRLLPITQS